MGRVTRHDVGQLAAPERTAEGFLRVEGVLARACILHYVNPDGSPRHELVTPEVLFDPASMHSLAGLALTLRHPDQLLTPETVSAHQVGSIVEPRRHGDELVSALSILRADAIKAVESGECRQLSVGYSCDVDDVPGEHPTLRCPQCGTGHYDGSQKGREGNHTAIVEAARAGNSARIHLDAAGNACDPFAAAPLAVVASSQQAGQPENPPMPQTIRIDSLTFNADDAHAPAIQQAIDRLLSDRQSKLDALTAEKVAIEKARADGAAKLDGYVKRVKAKWTGAKAKLDAMKARMIGCDECGSSGKVMDDAGKEAACGYCDGKGTLRMTDAIRAMTPPGGAEMDDDFEEGEAPDEDMEAMSDDLSGEPAAEEAVEKAANAQHKDPAKMDARRAARIAARAKRADSLARIADRKSRARAALITEAAPHLDAADKLDGKSDLEIRRAVLARTSPHLDGLDKMDAQAVGLLYTSEMKRLAGAAPAAPALSPSDAVLVGMRGNGHAPTSRADALSKAKEARDHALYHSHERPAAK